NSNDGCVLEKNQKIGLRKQYLELVERNSVSDDPRISRHVSDLGSARKCSHNHVVGRHQEEDRKDHQKYVRSDQGPSAIAFQAGLPLRSGGFRNFNSYRGHAISLPRFRTPRRMNTAAIARIGNMNNDVAAPKGKSPERIPRRKEYVANTCVMFRGPPAVMICTMSKLAKVTMREKST